MRPKLSDHKPFRNTAEIIRKLHTEGRVSEHRGAFRQIARSTQHGRARPQGTPGEAIELVRQTLYLTNLLVSIADRLTSVRS
jgi:hypothetical protein